MIISYEMIIDYVSTLPFKSVFYGTENGEISGFCSFDHMRDNCITWIKHTKDNSTNCFNEIASCLVVIPEKIQFSNSNVSCIITDSPKAVFFSILHHFFSNKTQTGISSSSVVETNRIGDNVTIGNLCSIGSEVVVEDNTVIENNVTLQGFVHIGKNCIIHSGVVIGTDGFGLFVSDDNIPQKVEHFGGVVIGDNVEIGANTCIDRGTIDYTYIGANTKIDNLCHIAHNVQIGMSCMIVAQSLICGSAKISDYSYIAPGAIVKNQKTIGKNSFVGMGAVVIDDVPDDMIVAGVPARVLRKREKSDL